MSSDIKTRVFCTFQFEGWHKWEAAPDSVRYLRDRHRHMFHVRVEKLVSHVEREIEFITLKGTAQDLVRDLQRTLREIVEKWSCERWANELLNCLAAERVEVSEDGENGAVVERV